MIRRNTWILLIVLLALLGLSYYLKDRNARQQAAATPTIGLAPLFDAAAGYPNDIGLESSAGVAVRFSRDESGTWVMRAPTDEPADQAAAEAAATQVGALKVLSSVRLGPDIIGLDAPAYTLTVGFGGDQSHKLLIGSVTPIQDGYYVQLDGGANLVVDKIGLDALIRLLTDPPFAATRTPTPEAPTGILPSAESGTPTSTP